MEVGLGPGEFVLHGDRAPPPQRGQNSPIFGPCLLWPNGWIDQDSTGGGPRSRLYCANEDPAALPQKGAEPLQFSAHFYCGQTAGCIKMPLGMKVGFGPGDFVSDGDPAPLLQLVGHNRHGPNFRPMSIVTNQLDGSRCHLVWR